MKNAVLNIDRDVKLSNVNKNIYGHFSEHLGRCIYDGIYVGENSEISNIHGMRKDVVEALKEIKIPVLRWPGGCFADEYHWKDGIGEKSTRKKMVNTSWGGVVEDNSFGTHEFMDLCEMLGCEPYIAGNLGSGTIQEMSEWIEYMTFDGVSPMAELRRKNGREKPWKVKYFGIGNENWGCGGNMRPEYYSDEYKRYQTFCKSYSGNELFKIACGPSGDDYNWSEKLLETVNNRQMSAYSLHYYTIPTSDWSYKGKALEFSEDEYYSTISNAVYIEKIIEKNKELIKKYDPEEKIKLIIDEWGKWLEVEEGTNPAFLYQQNTMRDAITAALNLNIFNNHSDVVIMANIAQVVNVLQSVVLTDGAYMVKTPTFYVFKMFVPHHDATLVKSEISDIKVGVGESMVSALSSSVTTNESGELFATIANCSLEEGFTLEINAEGVISAEIISADDVHDYNDFNCEEKVTLKEYKGYREENGKTYVEIPACSVVSVKFR